MPIGFTADTDSYFNNLMNKRFPQADPNRVPSPGGLDLNSLLKRGIEGTMAGAQEETGIKRQTAASDLLSQQLNQASAELANRMKGYEFGQTQRFDESLMHDPNLQATLADAFTRSGNPMLTAPTSRNSLAAFHQFDQSVNSHNEIAASILKNWAALGIGTGQPEPPEVQWARNVLRVPTTSGTSTNAPTAAKPAVSPPVPYGLGRSLAAGGVQGASYVAGSKGLPMLLSKFAPQMASKLPGWGKVAAGLGATVLGSYGYDKLIDPQATEAETQHPIAGGIGAMGGGMAANRLLNWKNLLSKLPEAIASEGNPTAAGRAAATRDIKMLGAPESAAPSALQKVEPGFTHRPGPMAPNTGGPEAGDFVRRFRGYYGRNPTMDEIEQFVKGFPPSSGLKRLPPAKTRGPSMGDVNPYPQ